MSRDWSRERWRRLYLTEALHKATWPLLARTLESYLVKRAQDDGFLAASVEGLIAALLPASEHEAEQTAAAISLLLEDGFLVETESGVFVVNLPAAQGDEPRPSPAPSPASTPSSKRGKGGWSSRPPEERKAAAQRAAEARWGRKTDASSDASPMHGEASATHPATHSDASSRRIGDASGGRAVSGQDNPTEKVSKPDEPDNQIIQTHARDASATHAPDASGDAPTHSAPASHRRTSTQSPKDDRGHGHGTEGSARIPKPKDSPLGDRELAQLEVDCPGLPRAFAELAVRDWLGEPADPADQRFPRQWKTHAIKLVRGSWRDAKRRRELLSVLDGGDTDAAAPPPVSAEETERFELEVERQRARQVARGLARAGAEEREQTLAELERHSPREARLVRQLLEGAA